MRPTWLTRRTDLLLLTAILLIAAFLRLYRLDAIPPGWTHDEAGHGHDAIVILNGARPIYETVGYGREPLYDYVVAGLMALIGPTSFALRLVSVAFGLATLVMTFVWARRAFDSPTALAAVALQAASFWSLATSRQALRSTLLPALFTAAIYFYWRCIDPQPSPSLEREGVGGRRGLLRSFHRRNAVHVPPRPRDVGRLACISDLSRVCAPGGPFAASGSPR